jgi:hypothetical protein
VEEGKDFGGPSIKTKRQDQSKRVPDDHGPKMNLIFRKFPQHNIEHWR